MSARPGRPQERPTRRRRSSLPPFEAFYAAALPDVLRALRQAVARRGPLPPHTSLSDLSQTAFTATAAQYHRMRNQTDARAYVTRAALNALADTYRHDEARTQRWWERVAGRHLRVARSPEGVALSAERRRLVREAVRALPKDQRDVVLLVRFHGLSYRQAARRLGTTDKAVDGLMQRAQATLRRSLSGLPGVVPWLRPRRPSWLAVATAPRLAVAALCLTVAQFPLAAVPMPYVGNAESAQVVPDAEPPDPAGAQGRSPHAAERVPAPRRAGAAAAPPDSPAEPPSSFGRKYPGPSAGVADCTVACMGEKVGDRACAHTGKGREPICANQNVVGICPDRRIAADAVYCQRHSEPFYDPPP